MDLSEKEVEEKLREAGEKLALLPTQVDVLLPILDEVENLLSKVEQSPSESIQNAYSQSMKALLEEPLLRHTDGDVQAAVASCISEITRITAPEAPYNDEEMKEVFKLIVSSFVDLSDMSSRSYAKRASILETVAKVRSCVVMLDLECEELIAEMFQHFLSSIRDEHPEKIFTSMETIMSLVLEESEDVSLELLTPILGSLERNNEEIPTAARNLGENVFVKCAGKLKPYLKQAVKLLGIPLDGYSKIVATICNGSNGGLEHKDGNVSSLEELAGESKVTTSSFVEAAQAQDAREHVTEEPCLEEVPPEVQKSMKSPSNGMTETVDEEMANVSDSLKKHDESNLSNKSLDVNTSKVEIEDIHTAKVSKVETKQVKIAKKRGRKPRSTEPSKPSGIESDNEAEITCQKAGDQEAEGGKDTHTSIDVDPHVDREKEQVRCSSLEPVEKEVDVSSGSPNKGFLDVSSPKKDGVSKEEENLAQEDALMKYAPREAFDGTSGKEISPESNSEMYSAQEDTLLMDSAPAKADDVNSDSEVEPQKCFGEKEESFVQEPESSKDPRAAADEVSDPEISIKKKRGHEDEPSEDLDSTKVSDGSSDSEKSEKITENLSQEVTHVESLSPKVDDKISDSVSEEVVAPVESLSPKVDDKISDSEDKAQKQSGKKKAARTKKAKATRISKGKMRGRKGTSKIQTEDSSEEEAEPEPEKQSSEEDGSDSETKPLLPPGKESTSGRRGKPFEKSGKGNATVAKLPSTEQNTNTASEENSSEENGSHPESNSDGSDSETKPVLHSGKGKRSRPKGKRPKSVGKGSMSGTKPSSKKEDTTNKDKDSSKKNGKNTKERVSLKSQAKHDDQDMIMSPNSTSKLVKDDDQSEDAKANSKRKRTPGKDKVSGDLEYGANLVGARIKVWWPDDEEYYEGIIESYDRAKKKHKVSYTDGDEEVLLLQKEKWELVDDEPMQEDTNEDSNPESSTKSRSRKKAKGNTAQKQKQMDVSLSPRRGGGAVSSKSKGSATKSSGKVDSKSKDKISKTRGKAEEDSESDNDMFVDDVQGSNRKSKDKSKVETPKAVTKAKGKTAQSGNTSNGMGKAKSGSSKVKDSGRSQVKSSDTSSAGKSRGKSGMKRRRGY